LMIYPIIYMINENLEEKEYRKIWLHFKEENPLIL
jgi:hypothetical protein